MYEPPGGLDGRVSIDPKALRRITNTAKWIVILLVAAAAFMGSVTPYTDYLWFVHDVRYPQVFTVGYEAKASLLFTCFVLGWALLYWSLRQALTLGLIFLSNPDSPGQMLATTAVKWITDKGKGVVRLGSPIVAFLFALEFSNEWNTLLMFQHARSFGVRDPLFGIDLGFYVFTLPWYRAVTNTAFLLLLLTSALSVGLYIGLQSIAMIARVELNRPRFRLHVGILIGATALSFALLTWLKTYEAGLMPGDQFTGAGYAGVQQVFAQRGFAIIAAVVGLVTLFSSRIGKPYAVPIGGGVIAGAFWVLGVVVYPTIVQRFVVDPDRLNKEQPFAQHAIHMTRFGYGLDRIDIRTMTVAPSASAQQVTSSDSTLQNMRLWDPEVLRQALENLQGIRPYYAFTDVDVDRYMLAGHQTMVMLSPRNISLGGLDPSAQNWTNLRLRYTHGYGLTMSRVDTATDNGQPDLLVRDIPVKEDPAFPLTQPQIYFADDRNETGDQQLSYALVNTGEQELDYQTSSGDATTQWQSDRGVPISGLLSRLAFSIVLGDGNLLVSPNVRPGAKLLMRRNVLERASKVYPFLRLDDDPYIVLLKGRLVWMLDGYTTSDTVPYSDRVVGDSAAINYIRNSVKVTIDAYTGETNAYAVEADEPILAAYRSIYPGLIHDLTEIPQGLREHFRYPEDLFRLQSAQLATYHVSDPTTFLSNADMWNIATERGLSGASEPIRPYYVQMQLPDEPKSGFLLILPFTPNHKPNMSGWLAAHCDPADYGRLTLYRFTGGSPVPGPELMESNFNSTPEVSAINRNYNNEQSQIIVGNLLVIPLGQTVLYAEPLFLRSRTSGIQAAPRLFRVILAFSNRVVVGDSYSDALRKLLGVAAADATTPSGVAGKISTRPGSPLTPEQVSTARAALKLFDQADSALRAGDFAKFGELQKEIRAQLQRLSGASNSKATPSP